jgi:steroid 5-alpha reductase family enzyme
MNAWWILLGVWIVAAVMMTLGWLWQRRHHNAGLVDVLWAAGLGGAALALALLGPGAASAKLSLGLLGGLWGARLAWHLGRRMRGTDEDGRYRALRAHWHDDQRKWFGFFQLQALSIPMFALPFVAVAVNRNPPAWAIACGAAIWLLAVAGESVADAQLARFRANPAHRGKTCRVGLWGYSRHPNYFCEWLHWFAYVLLAVGSPLWGLAWLGPLLMYVFLRYFSGIPYTETQALRSRGDDYHAYQRDVPMLFPRVPESILRVVRRST